MTRPREAEREDKKMCDRSTSSDGFAHNYQTVGVATNTNAGSYPYVYMQPSVHWVTTCSRCGRQWTTP